MEHKRQLSSNDMSNLRMNSRLLRHVTGGTQTPNHLKACWKVLSAEVAFLRWLLKKGEVRRLL